MYAIALFDSGNYALKLFNILERKGYDVEVMPTPCQIAKSGCSYSLKFPLEDRDKVLQEALLNNIAVREIYRVERLVNKNKYVKVY